jgi:hypothetical protein
MSHTMIPIKIEMHKRINWSMGLMVRLSAVSGMRGRRWGRRPGRTELGTMAHRSGMRQWRLDPAAACDDVRACGGACAGGQR